MATLIFRNPTEEQLKHIFDAEDSLAEAGITFDTSHSLDENGNWLTREWSLDWSLQGAEIEEGQQRQTGIRSSARRNDG